MGDFKNNVRDGFGKFLFNDGRVYEGMWSDGKQHGEGKLFEADGSVKDGTWNQGTFVNRRKSCLSTLDRKVVESQMSNILSNYAQPSS